MIGNSRAAVGLHERVGFRTGEVALLARSVQCEPMGLQEFVRSPLAIAVVTSNAGGSYAISGHGGTSASAPISAGIIALAEQYARRHLGFVNPAIYQIARSSHYHQAVHDVTAGNSNTAEFPHGTIAGYRASVDRGCGR